MATPLVTGTPTFAEAIGKYKHSHTHMQAGKDQPQQQGGRSYKLDGWLFSPQLESRLFSPRTKLIKRTDLTLKGIFQEYQRRPTNEYVLRLDSTAELNRSKIFDQWIDSIPRGEHGEQEERDLQYGGDLSG